MAKEASKKKGKSTYKEAKENISQNISHFFSFLKNEKTVFAFGIILLIISLFLLTIFVSFLSTGGYDQSKIEGETINSLVNHKEELANSGQILGAKASSFFINDLFGISSFFIPLFLLVAGFKFMKIRNSDITKWFFSCSLLMIWFSITLSFIFNELINTTTFLYWGGEKGNIIYHYLNKVVGIPGTLLLILGTITIYLVFTLHSTIIVIQSLFNKIKRFFSSSSQNIKKVLRASENDEISITEEEIKEKIELEKNKEFSMPKETEPEPITTTSSFQPRIYEEEQEEEEEEDDEILVSIIEKRIIEQTPKKETKQVTPKKEKEDKKAPELKITVGAKEEEYNGKTIGQYDPTLDLPAYKYPNIELLDHYESEQTIDEDEQNANKQRIIDTLNNYNIQISKIKATVGPTITLYEIIPAPGVRISKIKNLENDIALSLAALGIRIIAPIPGKGTVGIEVPNKKPQIVAMRSILFSKRFQESDYELPIALGKTITNEIFMVDLTKMPHILVAGATGQGKSVGLNAIITSLVYKKHPSQLKFVLIDPKKVEFSMYSLIEKHFLAKLPDEEEPIITDVGKVVNTLNSLTIEMDTRYDLLKKANVRNIKEYNNKFINRKLNPEKGHCYMPYIVVVIDEFGDLIMTAGKDVELPIARIAQLARAVGIHMIIATQRPSINIITGIIKANFPARVAFRVSSMIDSRTILDSPGANQLIGRGDLLFVQGSTQTRVQCALVETHEVEKINKYIAAQAGYPTAFLLPEYEENTIDGITNKSDIMRDRDRLFEEAARLLVAHQQGSTSLIQRRFSIGYVRAGRIMDQLQMTGIVGPSEGSKARQVLVNDELQLDKLLETIV